MAPEECSRHSLHGKPAISGSNLTLHSYHVTAMMIISRVTNLRKQFFRQLLSFFKFFVFLQVQSLFPEKHPGPTQGLSRKPLRYRNRTQDRAGSAGVRRSKNRGELSAPLSQIGRGRNNPFRLFLSKFMKSEKMQQPEGSDHFLFTSSNFLVITGEGSLVARLTTISAIRAMMNAGSSS